MNRHSFYFFGFRDLRTHQLCWWAFLVLFCLFALITSGCGYTFKSLVPPQYRTLYVKTFRNKIDISKETSDADSYKIYRPFLEVDITNEVINRFLYDGNFLIQNEQDASLGLTGELVGYIRQPLRFSDSDSIEEYRLSLIVNIRLEDLREGKVLLDQKELVGDTTYFTTGSLAKTEESALEDCIDDLARRIVGKCVEFW